MAARPVHILFAIAATPGSTLAARFGVRSTLLTGLVITAISGVSSGRAGAEIGINDFECCRLIDAHRHSSPFLALTTGLGLTSACANAWRVGIK